MRLTRAALQNNAQTFAKAQEIVRGIIQAEETPADPTDSAAETDRIAALFRDLQIDIERRFRWTRLDLGILGLDFVEIAELIEPQQTKVP